MRKPKSPETYVKCSGTPGSQIEQLKPADLILEFMLNAMRLKQGFHPGLFELRTGLSLSGIQEKLEAAREKELLEFSDELIRPTAKGRRFLNDLLALFMP
jgi:oxygen-independent coproporphyrinogen-3 oxidase